MDCYHFQELISDYIEGNLELTTKGEADVHLAECMVCKQAVVDTRKLIHSLHSLKQLKTSDDFEARLMARINEVKSSDTSVFAHFWQHYSRNLSVVAAVLVLLFGTWFTNALINPDIHVQTQPVSTIQQQNNLSGKQNAFPLQGQPLMVSDPVWEDSAKQTSANYQNRIQLVNDNQ